MGWSQRFSITQLSDDHLKSWNSKQGHTKLIACSGFLVGQMMGRTIGSPFFFFFFTARGPAVTESIVHKNIFLTIVSWNERIHKTFLFETATENEKGQTQI